MTSQFEILKLIPQELEQEKYHLRRRLEVAEEEYELKVSELHSDITVSFRVTLLEFLHKWTHEMLQDAAKSQ